MHSKLSPQNVMRISAFGQFRFAQVRQVRRVRRVRHREDDEQAAESSCIRMGYRTHKLCSEVERGDWRRPSVSSRKQSRIFPRMLDQDMPSSANANAGRRNVPPVIARKAQRASLRFNWLAMYGMRIALPLLSARSTASAGSHPAGVALTGCFVEALRIEAVVEISFLFLVSSQTVSGEQHNRPSSHASTHLADFLDGRRNDLHAQGFFRSVFDQCIAGAVVRSSGTHCLISQNAPDPAQVFL